MSDESEQSKSSRICTTCGKQRFSRDAASLTQWIFSFKGCQCVQEPAKTDQKISVKLCPNCGKRVSLGGPGSLTQWIFRAHMCKCGYSPLNEFIALEGVAAPTNVAPIDYIEEEPEGEDPSNFDDWIADLDERYKLLKRVGVGASGSVFLCYDRLLKKRVAVKCLTLIGAEQIISFQNEAKALSKLKHKNVVSVLDFGTSKSGTPYLVMEAVNGQSLTRHLRDTGRLSLLQAVRLGKQLCEGLAHVHESGLLHHDIQSSNVLLSGKELTPVLIDFGKAQEVTDSQQSLGGTPCYMAPDVMAGYGYDARSEIYSLGCVLFESIVGEPPFMGATAIEIMNKHVNEEPRRLADVLGTPVPPEVEYMVGKSLAKEPDARFQSMKDLQSLFEEQEIELAKTFVEKPADPKVIVSISSDDRKPGLKRKHLPMAITLIVCSMGALLAVMSTTLFKSERPAPVGTVHVADPQPQAVTKKAFDAIPPELAESSLPDRRPATLIDRAIKCWHRENYELALKYFDMALKNCSDAERLQAFSGKGDVYADMSDLKSAVKCYDQAIVVGKKSKGSTDLPRALRNRAKLFMRMEDSERAVADLTEELALERAAHYVTDGVFSERAKAYAAMKEYDRAIDDMSEAIKLKHKTVEAAVFYYERAKLYRLAGKLKEAEKDQKFADLLSQESF